MNKSEKYNQIFIEAFDLESTALNSDLKYQSVDGWDSVGHMSLISDIEDAFSITIDIDDIINFSSYEEGKEILKKYNIQL